jgi:hypothetical protein
MMLAISFAFAPAAMAADAKDKGYPVVKAAKGEKVCRYKFPDGEKRSWACAKEVPCCAWDAIKYVKCGTTWSGCL